MIKYKCLDEEINYSKLVNLWNDEMGFIYPIASEIFHQNIINSKYLIKKASFVAYNNSEIVGFILGKTFEEPLVKNAYEKGYISLFYVSKKFRNQGIGSYLLSLSENIFQSMGKTVIQIGADYNNFFPGLPCDFNNLSNLWFERRGYTVTRATHDLICRNLKDYVIKNQQYSFRFVKNADYERVMLFFERNFPGRWQLEFVEYFQNYLNDENYLIILDQDQVIGFSRVNSKNQSNYPYNITWHQRFSHLGGIGPLGVDKDYRHFGLGWDLVASSINYLKNKNCQEIIIDWTGLLEFYQKFGFEVWKSYLYCYKRFSL